MDGWDWVVYTTYILAILHYLGVHVVPTKAQILLRSRL